MATPDGQPDNKYGLLSSEIVDMLRDYEYSYFREDKPIPFCGLLIYPIQVRNFEVFSHCASCFTLNKNEDPQGVPMSHLDYLLSRTQLPNREEAQLWSYKINKIIELVFRITNGLKCKKCGRVMQYSDQAFIEFAQNLQKFAEGNVEEGAAPPSLKCPECDGNEFEEMIKAVKDDNGKYSLVIDGHTINKRDFNKLRQIVLYQNFYDYADDSWVDPAVKRDHDERMRIEQQRNDLHASIEKKVVCLSITTSYKFEEIYDMSIRKFTLALATVDDLINYKIMKQAVSSGFVSLPKGQTIEHWIYKPNKDMYGDAYKSTESVQEAVSNL
ncbi:MAG: hypothetical protein J6S67_07570 [Methanobrevibacter sp.]|nr:hypothetical protein [Methanobrevibacter sp.]